MRSFPPRQLLVVIRRRFSYDVMTWCRPAGSFPPVCAVRHQPPPPPPRARASNAHVATAGSSGRRPDMSELRDGLHVVTCGRQGSRASFAKSRASSFRRPALPRRRDAAQAHHRSAASARCHLRVRALEHRRARRRRERAEPRRARERAERADLESAPPPKDGRSWTAPRRDGRWLMGGKRAAINRLVDLSRRSDRSRDAMEQPSAPPHNAHTPLPLDASGRRSSAMRNRTFSGPPLAAAAPARPPSSSVRASARGRGDDDAGSGGSAVGVASACASAVGGGGGGGHQPWSRGCAAGQYMSRAGPSSSSNLRPTCGKARACATLFTGDPTVLVSVNSSHHAWRTRFFERTRAPTRRRASLRSSARRQ